MLPPGFRLDVPEMLLHVLTREIVGVAADRELHCFPPVYYTYTTIYTTYHYFGVIAFGSRYASPNAKRPARLIPQDDCGNGPTALEHAKVVLL